MPTDDGRYRYPASHSFPVLYCKDDMNVPLSAAEAAKLVPAVCPAGPRALGAPPSQILPNLYLGDHGASVGYANLIRCGISHVLNVKGGFRVPPSPFTEKLDIHSEPLSDFGTDDLSKKLPPMLDYIDRAMKVGAILIHCSQGINRSPSVVLAFLIMRARWSLREAWTFVRARRPCISPHILYWTQLQQLECREHDLEAPTLSADEAGIFVPAAEEAGASSAACALTDGCNISCHATPPSAPPPIIIPILVRGSDIERIRRYASQLHLDEDSEGWLQYDGAHEVKYLHHGGEMHDGVWRTFQQACKEVYEDILRTVRERAHTAGLCDASEPLNVRCIELHTYQAGGGLTDLGHCDRGSTLTVSVQLSPPGPPEGGGRFSTTDAAGAVTVHELGCGDAIVFHSEQVHNVSTLASGCSRQSLVMELWKKEENRKDRFA